MNKKGTYVLTVRVPTYLPNLVQLCSTSKSGKPFVLLFPPPEVAILHGKSTVTVAAVVQKTRDGGTGWCVTVPIV